ncbi:MAG TPA: hypothetical protein VFW63_05280, partial [Acidimicrobiales bacterium]|nr:hypothetical protein [Acidimicrobiales bacterium]
PAAHVPPADLAAGQATSGGLARRVRGAQLPSNQPLNLRRRRGDHPPTPPEGYGRGERDELYGQGPGDEQADGYANGLSSRRRTAPETGAGGHHNSTAHSVYGFLTSFTQGVQRGLEEARRDPNGPKENP